MAANLRTILDDCRRNKLTAKRTPVIQRPDKDVSCACELAGDVIQHLDDLGNLRSPELIDDYKLVVMAARSTPSWPYWYVTARA